MSGRIAQRKIKRLPVIFSDGKREYRGTTANLSHTGVFIRTRHILKPTTPIKLILELEDNSTIALTGIVVRFLKLGTSVFKDGMGIKLITIPEEYKDMIDKLLSE
jgi:Tfp pilus assembly protein PilZ